MSGDVEAAFTDFNLAVGLHRSKDPEIPLSTDQGTAVGAAYWAYLNLLPDELWDTPDAS